MPSRRSLLLASLLARPLRAGEPTIDPTLATLLTEEEEIKFGEMVAQKVRKGAPILQDTGIQQYVSQLALRIASHSQRPSLPYRIVVLDSREINANATFGGYIHVYRGLLHFVKDESELAGVLSHEVGHVAGRHAVKSLAREARVASLVKIAKSTIGLNDTLLSEIADIFVGAASVLPSLHFSREDELEADRLAVYQSNRAGFNPDGLLTFLARLSVDASDPSLVDSLLSTHPPPADRVQVVRAELREIPRRIRTAPASPGFNTLKEALAQLPPPPKPSRPGA